VTGETRIPEWGKERRVTNTWINKGQIFPKLILIIHSNIQECQWAPNRINTDNFKAHHKQIDKTEIKTWIAILHKRRNNYNNFLVRNTFNSPAITKYFKNSTSGGKKKCT
jgi:hypothetical protein